MTSSSDYTADKIQVLEGVEPVRLRPGMFIGSTDTKGLHHLLTEIIDNSIDEALSGNAQNIWVYLQKDGQARVVDDGRGIPVEKHPGLGISALEVAMTRLHAGAKFQKGTYKVSGGLHGVGASAVNALSQKMRVEVRRNGKLYYQEYRRGKPLAPVKEAPFPQDNLPKTGTQTILLPDPQIFEDTNFSQKRVEQSLRIRAYLIPGIFIHFFDERENYQKHFYFEGGIRSLLKKTNQDHKKISPIIYISKKDEKLSLEAEIAFQYIDDIEENIQSFVNVIPTPDEGTHVAGFRSGLTRVINDYALEKGLVKEGEKFSGEDTKEGLTAIIYVKMPSEKIQFESQTKTKLNNKEVGIFINQIVREELTTFLEEHPSEGRNIVEKIKIGLQARMAAKAARQAVLRKSALGSGSLPGKLADCQVKNPELAELFIVEGDSAGGSAKQGRDRRFQAIFPLRGKLLNTEQARLDKIIKFEELKNLVTVLGMGIGETQSPEKLRYQKVIIMTDADVDGEHIATLLLTFFYRHLPYIVENGYLYLAQPPLYKISASGKDHYVYSDIEREELLKSLDGQKVRIQRYKGLGEMNPDQLWQTTMDPNVRILKKITIEDAQEADHTFDMLLGKEVLPRRRFIQANAKLAELDV
ncbi:DNA gyrase subunit B [Candidatus Shapirobacteria bacterium]|nr:DNA gyrase subunit B [Candidatus Shapirobacteria bacterium]